MTETGSPIQSHPMSGRRHPRGSYVVSCGGVESRRKTREEALRLALIQERRHGFTAFIYIEDTARTRKRIK